MVTKHLWLSIAYTQLGVYPLWNLSHRSRRARLPVMRQTETRQTGNVANISVGKLPAHFQHRTDPQQKLVALFDRQRLRSLCNER